MNGIYIFDANESDFTNNGLGVLLPISCEVEGAANGMYELTLEMPIVQGGKFSLLQVGRVLKASVPVPEAPIDVIIDDPSVYEVWRLSALHDRVPLYAKIVNGRPTNQITRIRANAEMRLISTMPVPGSSTLEYAKVQLLKGGEIGYTYKNYLEYVRTVYDGSEETIPEVSREQLFRIYSVETNSDTNTVIVRAMHIFYDLRGSIIYSDYSPKNVEADEVLTELFDRQMDSENSKFAMYQDYFTRKISVVYGYRNFVDCLLNKKDGVINQIDAHILRDNFNIFIVANESKDNGVKISRGKNLESINILCDSSSVVTRIIPVGQTESGNPLYINGKYVDSSHINEYPFVFTKKIEYGIKVDPSGEYRTTEAAKTALANEAQREFDVNHVDLPKYEVHVEFIMTENTLEFERYSQIQKLYIFDIVTVEDSLLNVVQKYMVTGFVWDSLLEKYKSLKLESVQN